MNKKYASEFEGLIPENLIERDEFPGLLMMPDGSSYPRDCSKTGLNNNVAVIGPSGSGKTTIMAALNLINANSSFVISDPKGTLYRSMRKLLDDMGYTVMKLDLAHPEKSSKFNPLSNIKTTRDIRSLAHSIIYGRTNGENSKDPYWEMEAERMLCALIAYVVESDMPAKEKNLSTVMKLAASIEAIENLEDRAISPVFDDINHHHYKMEDKDEESWAYHLFKNYYSLAERTLSCIVNVLNAALTAFEGEELSQMLSGDDFDFWMLGEEKTAVFVIVPDSDRSMDTIANLFYTNAMNELCDYADNECDNGSLPVAVTFLLDDFATNCKIKNFENMISNIRARNISAIIMLQSISQLDASYGDGGQTILNNCDTLIFMGANALSDAEHFSQRANKPLHMMLEMPLHSSWIFRRSEKPRFVMNIDPRSYLDAVAKSIETEYRRYEEEFGEEEFEDFYEF